MKKFYGAVAALLICAAMALPAAGGTLNALPAWDAPHMLVHVEDISQTLSRLGNSFLFELLLDESVGEQVKNYSPDMRGILRFAREGFLDWVKNFPVESFSLVNGVMLEDKDTFQGAVRFSPGKQEILARISMIADEEDAEEKLKEALLDLLGVSSGQRIFFDGSDVSIEGANLYEVDMAYTGCPFPGVFTSFPTFYTSVGKDGDENILPDFREIDPKTDEIKER